MKTKSPKQKTIKKLKFLEALTAIKNGKKVHKLEWEDKNFYGFLNNDILSLHKPDNANYQWILSKADMLGEDYVIIK